MSFPMACYMSEYERMAAFVTKKAESCVWLVLPEKFRFRHPVKLLI
jgi:hypothetical protein